MEEKSMLLYGLVSRVVLARTNELVLRVNHFLSPKGKKIDGDLLGYFIPLQFTLNSLNGPSSSLSQPHEGEA